MMKKSIFVTLLCAITLGMAGVMISCGGNNAAAKARTLISEAEQKVPEKASPSLGSVPSLQLQYSEAKSLIKEQMKQRKQEIKEKFKDGGSLEDAMREYEKLDDEEKLLAKEVEKVYLERIMKEAEMLDGKAIICEADGKQYGRVVGKLVCAKDSSIVSPLTFEAEVTLEAPYKSSVPYCTWKYIGMGGDELASGAMPLKDIPSVTSPSALKSGDKFTFSFKIAVTKEKGMDLKKIIFVP